MAQEEICVCYFVTALDESQSKISRHLAYLRRSGLASARRQGKWMHYRLELPHDPLARQALETAIAWIRRHKEAEKDQSRYKRACCAPEKFVLIANAPPPTKVKPAFV
jgi:ArsR family transcriptional regulator